MNEGSFCDPAFLEYGHFNYYLDPSGFINDPNLRLLSEIEKYEEEMISIISELEEDNINKSYAWFLTKIYAHHIAYYPKNEQEPPLVLIFAGGMGAGKTESAKALLSRIVEEEEYEHFPAVISADLLRSILIANFKDINICDEDTARIIDLSFRALTIYLLRNDINILLDVNATDEGVNSLRLLIDSFVPGKVNILTVLIQTPKEVRNSRVARRDGGSNE